MQADFIVAGATLIDGTGGPARQGDLAVRDGRIVAVGAFDHPPGARVIAAAGMALAPGFIDSHTHDDGYLLAHPDMLPKVCLLYTSPSPRDKRQSRMPSSA